MVLCKVTFKSSESRRKVRCCLNNELERKTQGSIVAYLKIQPQHVYNSLSFVNDLSIFFVY